MNQSDIRYERKLKTQLSLSEIESLVQNHPMFFRRLYPQRVVNNIYFDTYNFTHFHENVNGDTNRIKVRVRWYGDLMGDINSPQLEIKRKKGWVGDKLVGELNRFTVSRQIQDIDFQALFKDIDWDLKDYRPSLINRYQRQYYQSICKRYRLTIDDQLAFFTPHSANQVASDDHTIVEIKYHPDHESDIDQVCTVFPFRMTKSSKYVTGIEHLH